MVYDSDRYSKKNPLRHTDWFTVILILILMFAGWVSVIGACHEYGDPLLINFAERTGKQLIWIGLSLLLALTLLLTDNRYYETFARFFYLVMMILLVITPFIASDIKGSYSWIKLGSGVNIQPAEFAKCATSLALAKMMGTYGFTLTKARQFVQALLIIIIPLILIIMQHETGSALVFLAFFLVFYREGMSGYVLFSGLAATLYFVLSLRFQNVEIPGTGCTLGLLLSLAICWILSTFILLRNTICHTVTICLALAAFLLTLVAWYISVHYFSFNISWILTISIIVLSLYTISRSLLMRRSRLCLIALFAIGSLVMIHSVQFVFSHMEPHQQARIKVLLGLEENIHGAGYNVHQSIIAIGSGGLTGKGFLNGTQTRLKYVPEQDTDFIFSAIGEEHGFVGCSIVLILFIMLILRIIHIAERQTYPFGRVYGYCVASILLFHLTINVGMVLGIAPVIGIPLPFFSYGGSSLWGFTLLIFILLRIDSSQDTVSRL